MPDKPSHAQSDGKLGIALIGAGFVNTFHANSLVGVRNADIVSVYSRSDERAKKLAALCKNLGIGSPRVFTDVARAVRHPAVNAAWLGIPNDARVDVVKAITEEVTQGRSNLKAIACEKPLARTVKEAKEMLRLVERAGVLHGYLENQVFSPSLVKGKNVIWEYGTTSGRPYLARASEEHGGPHASWFWIPKKSGGGALMDMMCHSLEATRYLLTAPKEKKTDLKVRSVSAQIASLKWTQPEYIERLKKRTHGQVDNSRSPPEDFAKSEITYEAPNGQLLIAETSVLWCFTGPGVRLTLELIGPEYYMHINTLEPELHVFFSRNIKPKTGEFLVEKQEAEQGLMPTVPDEPSAYGYEAENRHMVQSFLAGKIPDENWHDGLFILQLMMSCYLSAEKGKKIRHRPSELEEYIPNVVSGTWNPAEG